MSFLKLSAGDAIYVPADAPHAYLSGDIVECMARSNHVINTGFCPRADRDSVDLFTSTLTFAPHNAEEVMLPSKKSSMGMLGTTVEYVPPLSEFNMLKIQLTGEDKEVIKAINGPSVLFVTSGTGSLAAEGETWSLKEGFIFFVGHSIEVTYQSDTGIEVYSAYAE